jgi:HK97 family phage major capsid protein
MNYAEVLRSQVDALEAERTALLEELDTLTPDTADETRSVEVIEARATEIVERAQVIKADVAAKVARIGELADVATERAALPTINVIKEAPKMDATDIRSASPSQIKDGLLRSLGERDTDDTNMRALLKRHGGDVAWSRNLLARSTDVYAEGFSKYLTGREMLLSHEERTAMSVGTSANGGFLLPTHLDPSIILTSNGSTNILRQIAKVVTITEGKTWNGITSAGVAASFDAELAEVSDDSPTVGNPQVTVHKAQALVQASIEAFEDISSLGSEVLMLFADAKDVLEGSMFATGSGTAQPWGIFTALDANTNVEVTSTTAATIGLVDLQGLKRAVPQRFRGRSAWLMNPVYADAIKALGTALSASYSTDLTEANANRLLNLPVYESDDAPTTQTTTVRDNEVVVGDFSNYVIVDKPGSTSIEFIPHLFNTSNNLPDGRRAWYMHWRTGADSVNDLAFRLLQDKTTA